MDKFVINGGKALTGTVRISGAKNSAVAILPAVLLADSPCIIENLPDISDVSTLLNALRRLGAVVNCIDESTVEIDPRPVNSFVVDKDMAEGMRASCYFLGALLGRCGRARVAPPGGCNFGERPINLHIDGFRALGAHVDDSPDLVVATADELHGCTIRLEKVSVGATINIMLAAAKAHGLTVIENAAREPHIVDLANFLNYMGAKITGAGYSSTIKIQGVENLHGATHRVIPDQIEAGTYMVAAAATKGNVLIDNVEPKHLESIIQALVNAGADVTLFEESVRVKMSEKPKNCDVIALPHPKFPTDMQPQITTFLSVADGTSYVTDGVWDDRFRYVEQLRLMGANILVFGKTAIITGVEKLNPAIVKAVDLRAGAAMIIAGLMSEGTTEVHNTVYIDRGYQNIAEKLQNLGADIKRVSVTE